MHTLMHTLLVASMHTRKVRTVPSWLHCVEVARSLSPFAASILSSENNDPAGVNIHITNQTLTRYIFPLARIENILLSTTVLQLVAYYDSVLY